MGTKSTHPIALQGLRRTEVTDRKNEFPTSNFAVTYVYYELSITEISKTLTYSAIHSDPRPRDHSRLSNSFGVGFLLTRLARAKAEWEGLPPGRSLLSSSQIELRSDQICAALMSRPSGATSSEISPIIAFSTGWRPQNFMASCKTPRASPIIVKEP